MLKRILPLLLAPVLFAGCAATITNLSPHQMSRSPDNTYLLEVRLDSRQQTLRWESIQPKILAGAASFPMRPTPLMKNRWEGRITVPPGTDVVHYQYKFDFTYNSFGKPKPDSALSPEYSLRIVP
jgi:hypothetical protein